MTLSDYIAQPGNSATKLAAACRVSPSTITRLAKGDQWAGLQLLRDIAEHTDGNVTPNDFLGPPENAR